MSKKRESLKKSTLFKKTIPYIKHEWKLFLLTIVFSLLISVSSASTPFITKAILDEYLPKNEYSMVTILLCVYLSIAIALLASRYLFMFVTTYTGMRIEKKIREEAMAKINRLPVDYFSLEPDGKIVAKITSDSAGVRTFYTTLFTIINALMNITIVYVGVIILNPMLGLLVLILIPILLLWITLYRKWVHRYYLDLRELGSRITGKLNENITGALLIQDFNLEHQIRKEYQDITGNYIHFDRVTSSINNTCGFELLNFIKRLAEIALLMYLGFKSISIGGAVLTIGIVGALVENLDKMINPLQNIFDNLNELEDSLVGASRVYMFLDEKEDTRYYDGAKLPIKVMGTIDFKNVSFSYVENTMVLKNISLHVDSGKTIGIVGATGSGKSSMMNLLLAYNDYQEGEILLDSIPITNYNKLEYRKDMGIVLQVPAIFQGTLKSNVSMERDYPDQQIYDALVAVGAEYLATRTKEGLNMEISFRGENLSLGEKQLIAFARVLIRNPKVLVLDEATANIDSETEEKIQKAMALISKGRTTFIIAHRLSTIKNADEIIVLDNGNIVGKGTHASLYQNCLVYKDMYDSQYKIKI